MTFCSAELSSVRNYGYIYFINQLKQKSMATRSRIAMEMADGKVKSIYCHWDGYPSNNGRILQECYLDRTKVEDLIELGDISSLGNDVTPTGPHTFNDPQPGVTIAYRRDRGEDHTEPMIHKSVPDFFNSDIEEYGYLFTQEGEWLVKRAAGKEDPSPLAYVLLKFF